MMSEVEKFIEENTRNCSQLHYNSACTLRHCITPDQAREAVKIAREEMIELFCEWVKKNVTYTHPRKETEECLVNISKLKEDLKQAIKDE